MMSILLLSWLNFPSQQIKGSCTDFYQNLNCLGFFIIVFWCKSKKKLIFDQLFMKTNKQSLISHYQELFDFFF